MYCGDFFLKSAHSEEIKNKVFIKSSMQCGLSISIPQNLESVGDAIFPCIGSYKNKEGAVISLTLDKVQGAAPNWIEMQPLLHVYEISADDLLSERESQRTNFIIMSNGVVGNRYEIKNCGSHAKTKMVYLEGKNWKGWLAEDSYNEKEISQSKEEYCEEFKKINQCVRLLIGNENISASMNQYCFSINNKDFDLDDRLSLKIFMAIVLSIEFFYN